jgi:hypothetical protein
MARLAANGRNPFRQNAFDRLAGAPDFTRIVQFQFGRFAADSCHAKSHGDVEQQAEPGPNQRGADARQIAGIWVRPDQTRMLLPEFLRCRSRRQFNAQITIRQAFSCRNDSMHFIFYPASACDCFTNSSAFHSASPWGAWAAAFWAALRSACRFTRSACVVK